MDLIRADAANLVELKPDVIVAIGGRVIPVLMQMTRSVPIIIPGGIYPVGRGWIESLARPGGNVTGFRLHGVLDLRQDAGDVKADCAKSLALR